MTNIPNSGLINLNSVLKRLESTTTRLEDILLESSFLKGGQPTQPVTDTATPPAQASQQPQQPTQAAPAQFIVDYESLLSSQLSQYTSLSQQVGGQIHTQSQHLATLLNQTLDIILIPASNSKPPKNLSSFQNSLSPLIDLVNKVIHLSDTAPSSNQSQQLKTVAEGVPAFGWFTIAPKPAPYIQDFKDAAQFYANRVIKEYKESDDTMVQWSKSFIGLLEQVRQYVQKHHSNGLSWNEKDGVPYEEYVDKKSDSSEGATPTNNSAPPPPPAPAPPAPTSTSTQQQPDQGPEAVFAQLNKGSDITKGLRKVDKSEMTHKNPSLRQNEAAGSAKKPQPPIAAKPKSLTRTSSQTPSKPPKTELDGQKWFVVGAQRFRETNTHNTHRKTTPAHPTSSLMTLSSPRRSTSSTARTALWKSEAR